MRTFVSEDGLFALQIPLEIHDQLQKLCASAWPNETGGVLVGHYSCERDTAVVTQALEPPRDSVHGRSRFSRGLDGISEVLLSLWRKPPSRRRYYLGEWHSHPSGDAAPSPRDANQMQRIAEGTYHCPEPILLLLAGSPRAGWRLRAWVFRCGLGAIELKASCQFNI